MRFGFAGDRVIALKILATLKSQDLHPSVLIVGDSKTTSHADALIEVSELENEYIIHGSKLKSDDSINLLKRLNLDYIFGIHFPYIIPTEILNIPTIGFLNLHPAYLPYNKGWHTPSWAIYDNTPYGATLHFMSEKLDEGDIIHQKKIEIAHSDTANSLYQKVLDLEYNVFMEALPELIQLKPNRQQQVNNGTSHNKNDLSKIAEIDLDKSYKAKDLITKLRALTTNKVEEGAFFRFNDKKYFIQVHIEKDE